MKKQYSFIDFLMDIADCVVNNKSVKESPYDVNFSNHYKTLYTVEETLKHDYKTKLDIKDVVQNKRSKSITINTNIDLNKDSKKDLQEYFTNNNIDCEISRNKLKNITINKNTKGVLEERNWKENDLI